MNKHALIDSLPVTLAAFMFGNSKMFRESIESPSYEELLKTTTLKYPDIKGEGFYEVQANTLIGQLDPAFYIAQWKGYSYPTLIYHHGNNERPFHNYGFGKNTFKRIFLSVKKDIPANLIVVRAPYHCCFRTYLREIGKLSTLTSLMIASVKVVETLVDFISVKGSRIVLSGISLGGWVTNLHRTFFNSADFYIPLLAGTVPSDVFTSSIYRELTADLAHENRSAVEETLDFKEQFAKRSEDNISPLLASYDQVMRLKEQKESYGKHPAAVIEKGHFTGSLASDELRKHILPHLLGRW